MSASKIYTITEGAFAALREHGARAERPTAVRQPDGYWRVIISDETIDRLKNHAVAGESLSDTIVRVCYMATSGGRLN